MHQKFNYVAVIAVTGITVRSTKARVATANDIVAEIHKPYLITDDESKNGDDKDEVNETALTANSDIE